jgi:asparagine synthase (glutamine-hydrolysing)
MCGLAGLLLKNGYLGSEIEPILQTMGQQIAHRGPDDEQIFINGSLGAVFRRLSIVDVVGGRQPLFNEDHSLMLMVNGEIYNHRDLKSRLKQPHQFRTQSDCEIILHLYEEKGEDFVNDLNGMFTLVLWDQNLQRLILARDRLGIKPLYYTESNQRLLFGSEIKALLAYPDCPRELNWVEALSYQPQRIFSDDYLPSFFKNINYLPAGHLLIADQPTNRITVKRYWRLTPLSEEEYASDTRSEQEIIAGYGELLADSVKLRLMADVEVGLFLSGGIDSVSVATLAARHQQLHTFSVLSQSTFQNGDAQAGHLAAKYLDIPNHQILYSWHDNPFTQAHWKALLWLCETPLCNAEHLYKYHLHRYAKHLRPALKVILLGQGSDEFNGGYSVNYVKTYRSDLTEEERNWSAFIEIFSDFEKDALIAKANADLAQYGGVLTKDFLASCSGQTYYRHPWFYHVNKHLQSLQIYNLWHEDRTAAGNSIENRVPFLDHRLVEYLMKIPPQKYEALFWDKAILRQAMKHQMPPELNQRPKCPFFYGEDIRYTRRMMFNLLTADDNALIREAFGEEKGATHPVFDRLAIERLINNIPEEPDYNLLESLLPLVNMGLLAKMAQAPINQNQYHVESIALLPEITIDDWEEQADSLALQLAIRREKAELLDRIVALTPGTQLLKIDQTSSDSACSYISINDQIEYELPEAEMKDWLAVLRRIDGQHSINEILSELEMPVSKIRKHLEEALDYGILYFLAE